MGGRRLAPLLANCRGYLLGSGARDTLGFKSKGVAKDVLLYKKCVSFCLSYSIADRASVEAERAESNAIYSA